MQRKRRQRVCKAAEEINEKSLNLLLTAKELLRKL